MIKDLLQYIFAFSILIIGINTFYTFSLIINMNNSTNKINFNYLPIIKNINNVKSLHTTTHLYSEEFLYGDSSIAIKDIFGNYAKIENILQETKKLCNDAKIATNTLELIIANSRQLKSLMQSRYEKYLDGHLDEIDDIMYDGLFDKTIKQFDIILPQVDNSLQFSINEFHEKKYILFFSIIVLLILLFFTIYQYTVLQKNNNLKLEKEIEKKDELISLIHTIIQTAPLRIFWKDKDLKYLGCNDLFAKDAGFKSASQIINKNDFDMVWKEQANLYRSDDTDVIRSGKPKIGYEEPQTTSDGETIWLRTSKVPLLDVKTGKRIGILGVYDDVTKEREFAQSLQKFNETLAVKVKEEVKKNQEQADMRLTQLAELISMIAHQWRQPLTSIGLVVQKINLAYKKGALDDSMMEQSVTKMLRIVEQMSSTIDDFRNFYKPNKKRASIQLREVISQTLNVIGDSLAKNNIEVVTDFSDNTSTTIFQNEMFQVVLNILKNAQDNFTEKEIDNASIHISTSDNFISINDNGGGIPIEMMDKIFDPYFSTKSEKNGTGLGLYMSKIIVEEHHKGKLDVYNKNGGVCFEIELPTDTKS